LRRLIGEVRQGILVGLPMNTTFNRISLFFAREIRIPPERARRERERRRAKGLMFMRKVIDSLNAL